MSTRELERVEVMGRVAKARLKLVDAAVILQLSYRQVKRLWRRYHAEDYLQFPLWGYANCAASHGTAVALHRNSWSQTVVRASSIVLATQLPRTTPVDKVSLAFAEPFPSRKLRILPIADLELLASRRAGRAELVFRHATFPVYELPEFVMRHLPPELRFGRL